MPSDPGPEPPDAASLYQAALHYLARYAATEAGVRRVLVRRIDLWARAQPDPDAALPLIQAAQGAIDGIVTRLTESGAISDAAFAENRARSLVRSGQSTRAIQLRLVAKGVKPDIARTASTTDTETELAAALVLARKRRIGPYRATGDADIAVRTREMAVLARGGFSRDVALRALATSRDEAEARILEMRR